MTLLAQVQTAPLGLSTSFFSPVIYGVLAYVILLVAGSVLTNRGRPVGRTFTDVAFVLLLLLGVYVAVLLVIAIAQRYDLIVRMIEVLAIVLVFFGILILIMFAIGRLVALIGRVVGRSDRVTADGGDAG